MDKELVLAYLLQVGECFVQKFKTGMFKYIVLMGAAFCMSIDEAVNKIVVKSIKVLHLFCTFSYSGLSYGLLWSQQKVGIDFNLVLRLGRS